MPKDRITFRAEADLLLALERAAKEDSRTLTGLIVKILSDKMRATGYLNGKKARK